MTTGSVAEQQDFDLSSAVTFLAVEAGCSHPSVVDDDKIAGHEQVGEVSKRVVGHVAGIEQSSRVARLDWLLGDHLVRQEIGEVGGLHSSGRVGV